MQTRRIQLWDEAHRMVILCVLIAFALFPARSFAAPPPVIAVQPLDQTVIKGGTAIFTVVAVSGTTLSYSWYFDGNRITGATSSTYIRTNVQASDAKKFYVKVTNAGGTVNSREATLYVVNNTVGNDPPVANDDAYTTPEDVPLTIPTPGILANDMDADGDVLTVQLVSDVSHGALLLNPDGSFTYTPSTNYYGSDSFTYSAFDGLATGNVASVTINLTPVNDPPIAVDDTTNTLEDVSVTIKVRANDSDPEGTSLTVTGTSTTNGTAVISGNNVIFTPATNFNGIVVFNYTISDGTNFATANVTVTVAPVNDAPVANNDTYAATEDTPLIVPAVTGILANDTDVESDAITALLVSNVNHGSLSLNSDGSFSYTPTNNYFGVDSFTYRPKDAVSTGNVATVTINLTGTYDPPVAVNDSTNTPEDVSVTIKVTRNDSNPDGTPLTITSTATTNGVAVISGTNIIFTASTNFNGTVVFSYTISDGINSSTANVTVTVTAVNDAPIAVSDSTNTLEDVSVTINVLANDSDVEGSTLYVTGTSTTNGTAFVSGNKVVFKPATNFNGTAFVTYTVSDGSKSSTGNVTVTVTPVNDAPMANNDTYTTPADSTLTIPGVGLLSNGTSGAGILANDLDVDGDALTAVLVSDVSHGSLKLNPDGSFTYTPTNNYFGSDSFTYRAYDGFLTSAVATVTLTIFDNTPLSFSSAGMSAKGFELQLSGPSGSTYVILASTNTLDWTPIYTNSAPTGSVVFTDTDATNNPVRFYRAVAR